MMDLFVFFTLQALSCLDFHILRNDLPFISGLEGKEERDWDVSQFISV